MPRPTWGDGARDSSPAVAGSDESPSTASQRRTLFSASEPTRVRRGLAHVDALRGPDLVDVARLVGGDDPVATGKVSTFYAACAASP